MLTCLRGAGLSALLVPPLSLPAAADPPELGYAGTKIASPARTSRASVRLVLSPVDWPRRGMLVARGNTLSPLARWIVVDLDSRTIRQATTRLPDGGGAVRTERERTDALSPDELRAVTAAANETWSTRDPDPPRPGEVTDRLCNVTLFDGDEVLHEVGSNCPRAGLVATLEAVAASAERRMAPPKPSPDAC